MTEELEKLENKINEENELEQCVLCWKFLDIKKDVPIDLRKFYIEGAGQLCEDCYKGVYC